MLGDKANFHFDRMKFAFPDFRFNRLASLVAFGPVARMNCGKIHGRAICFLKRLCFVQAACSFSAPC